MKYFYVYQNKTYYDEKKGGFLWSPKFAKGIRLNPGYEAMKEVQPGDIIFHSYMGKIMAISKAKSNCYTSLRPNFSFDEWANDGWRIDVEYFTVRETLTVAPYIPYLYKIQPQNGPFRVDFKGKQQYLCNCNKPMFEFLINKIKEIQYFESEKKRIDEFLKLPVTDSEPVPDSEPTQPARYVVCPSCGLNYMKEGQSACDCCLRKK